MKKPIVSIKKGRDVCKLLLCLILSASALMLFCLPEQSVTVFSNGGDNGIKSLIGLVKQLI